MTITEYTPTLRRALEEMLVAYFVGDLESDIPEEILRGKLMKHITESAEKGTIHIAVALDNGMPIGFSIYQIDSVESDWCKRPGWGFIREFYICKEHRRQSWGRVLAAHTELALRNMGAVELYLTSDNAIGFWQGCGWRCTGEKCSNDLEIMIK